MERIRTMLLLAAGIALFGCYHATIDTELTPSTVTIEKSFAAAWIYGLVPPKAVATAEECPDGVAKVETQLSFVNQLVSFLTIGIFTPMHIKVTCAMGSGTASTSSVTPDVAVDEDATLEEKQQALTDAVELSLASRSAVIIKL